MAVDPDAVLVRRMAQGDESALGAFYDRWAKHVNSVVRRTTRDTDDADRIVDATFWYAWNTSAWTMANLASPVSGSVRNSSQ